MNTLMGIVATKEHIHALAARVETLEDSVSTMVAGQDGYLKRTHDWKQEQDPLRAGQAKVKQVLIRKGIASEQELAV
jgi:hypothetical protein